jgi:hypothetical protein
MNVLLLPFLSTSASEHEVSIAYGGMGEVRAKKMFQFRVLSRECSGQYPKVEHKHKWETQGETANRFLLSVTAVISS